MKKTFGPLSSFVFNRYKSAGKIIKQKLTLLYGGNEKESKAPNKKSIIKLNLLFKNCSKFILLMNIII